MEIVNRLLRPVYDYVQKGTSEVKTPKLSARLQDRIQRGVKLTLGDKVGKGAEHVAFLCGELVRKVANPFGSGWQPGSPEARMFDLAILEEGVREMERRGLLEPGEVRISQFIIFGDAETSGADELDYCPGNDRGSTVTEAPALTAEDPSTFDREQLKYSDLLMNKDLQRRLFALVEMGGLLQQGKIDLSEIVDESEQGRIFSRGLDLMGGQAVKYLLQAGMQNVVASICEVLPASVRRYIESKGLLDGIDVAVSNVLFPREDRPMPEEVKQRFMELGGYSEEEVQWLTRKGEFLLGDFGLHNRQEDMPAYSKHVIEFLNQLMMGLMIETLRDLDPERYGTHNFGYKMNPTLERICQVAFNLVKVRFVTKESIAVCQHRSIPKRVNGNRGPATEGMGIFGGDSPQVESPLTTELLS